MLVGAATCRPIGKKNVAQRKKCGVAQRFKWFFNVDIFNVSDYIPFRVVIPILI